MDIAEPILKLFKRADVPQIEVGDVVRVHQKIREGDKERVQVFEGMVIAKHERTSLDATFTVRKIASGVGVEKVFLLHSPNLVKIEFKRRSQVRRAKLYSLRALVGKALKLRERKGALRENWEFIAANPEEATEPTEADLAEAVEAEAEKQQVVAEQSATNDDTVDTEVVTQPTDGAVPTEETTDAAANDAGGSDQPTATPPESDDRAAGSE